MTKLLLSILTLLGFHSSPSRSSTNIRSLHSPPQQPPCSPLNLWSAFTNQNLVCSTLNDPPTQTCPAPPPQPSPPPPPPLHTHTPLSSIPNLPVSQSSLIPRSTTTTPHDSSPDSLPKLLTFSEWKTRDAQSRKPNKKHDPSLKPAPINHLRPPSDLNNKPLTDSESAASGPLPNTSSPHSGPSGASRDRTDKPHPSSDHRLHLSPSTPQRLFSVGEKNSQDENRRLTQEPKHLFTWNLENSSRNKTGVTNYSSQQAHSSLLSPSIVVASPASPEQEIVYHPDHHTGTGTKHDPLKTLSSRTNYASFDCSASIHRSSKSSKSPSSILNEKKDKYMLTPCRSSSKHAKDAPGQSSNFVIFELCDEIEIDNVVLANFEFFSSMFKLFRLSVSKSGLEGAGGVEWVNVGLFRTRNVRGLQVFAIKHLKGFYRYVRLDFLSHYGSEYYCPLSLVRIYGLTQIDAYRRDEELERRRHLELKDVEDNLQPYEGVSYASEFESASEFKSEAVVNYTDGPSALIVLPDDIKLETMSHAPEKLRPYHVREQGVPEVSQSESGASVMESDGTQFPLHQQESSLPPHTARPAVSTIDPIVSPPPILGEEDCLSGPVSQTSEPPKLNPYGSPPPHELAASSRPSQVEYLLSQVTPADAHIDDTANVQATLHEPFEHFHLPSEAIKENEAVAGSDETMTTDSGKKSDSTSNKKVNTKDRVEKSHSPVSEPLDPKPPTEIPSEPTRGVPIPKPVLSTVPVRAQVVNGMVPSGGSESIFGQIMKRLSNVEANLDLSLKYVEEQVQLLEIWISSFNKRLSDFDSHIKTQEAKYRKTIIELNSLKLKWLLEQNSVARQLESVNSSITFIKFFGLIQFLSLLAVLIFLGLTRFQHTPTSSSTLSRLIHDQTPQRANRSKIRPSFSAAKESVLYHPRRYPATRVPNPTRKVTVNQSPVSEYNALHPISKRPGSHVLQKSLASEFEPRALSAVALGKTKLDARAPCRNGYALSPVDDTDGLKSGGVTSSVFVISPATPPCSKPRQLRVKPEENRSGRKNRSESTSSQLDWTTECSTTGSKTDGEEEEAGQERMRHWTRALAHALGSSVSVSPTDNRGLPLSNRTVRPERDRSVSAIFEKSESGKRLEVRSDRPLLRCVSCPDGVKL